MPFPGEEIAAVYALDLRPKVPLCPSTALGLYYSRPYQEYRIVRPNSGRDGQQCICPQLSLALEAE